MSHAMWKEKPNGNESSKLDGQWCTVFFSNPKNTDFEPGWKWVRNDEFSEAIFETKNEAKENAEETFLFKEKT